MSHKRLKSSPARSASRLPVGSSARITELGIDRVSIINGFARNGKLWKANGRVKALKVYFDGRYRGTVQLEDTAEPRSIDLPKMAFTPGRAHDVAFEIAEVYPGTEYEDTAIADFFFSGFGVH